MATQHPFNHIILYNVYLASLSSNVKIVTNSKKHIHRLLDSSYIIIAWATKGK